MTMRRPGLALRGFVSLAGVALAAACSSGPTQAPPTTVATGPVLTALANGPLVCPRRPLGCVLSLEVAPGSGTWEEPVNFTPRTDHQFQPTDSLNVFRPPDATPMSVAPGPLRVAAVLTNLSDVASPPNGPSFAGIGWICQTQVDVKPSTRHVSVSVELLGLLPCSISATLD
ncbi:MAG TPA: hypothetical protein VFY18_14765 [Candidatus Limnocylindrales bacterium]|nr:hypothetical protein [Candidatus Limnocylindrales bacterium]